MRARAKCDLERSRERETHDEQRERGPAIDKERVSVVNQSEVISVRHSIHPAWALVDARRASSIHRAIVVCTYFDGRSARRSSPGEEQEAEDKNEKEEEEVDAGLSLARRS